VQFGYLIGFSLWFPHVKTSMLMRFQALTKHGYVELCLQFPAVSSTPPRPRPCCSAVRWRRVASHRSGFSDRLRGQKCSIVCHAHSILSTVRYINYSLNTMRLIYNSNIVLVASLNAYSTFLFLSFHVITFAFNKMRIYHRLAVKLVNRIFV